MKECFGVGFALFRDDEAGNREDRERCHACEDFERCYMITLVKSLNNLKLEMRSGVRNLRNSMGGSHSEHPLGF